MGRGALQDPGEQLLPWLLLPANLSLAMDGGSKKSMMPMAGLATSSTKEVVVEQAFWGRHSSHLFHRYTLVLLIIYIALSSLGDK